MFTRILSGGLRLEAGVSTDMLKIRTLFIKGGAASRSAMIRAVEEHEPFSRAPGAPTTVTTAPA